MQSASDQFFTMIHGCSEDAGEHPGSHFFPVAFREHGLKLAVRLAHLADELGSHLPYSLRILPAPRGSGGSGSSLPCVLWVEYGLFTADEPYILNPYVGRRSKRCPTRGNRVGCPSNAHRRAARVRDEFDLPGPERALGQFSEVSLFVHETLLTRES